MNLHLIGIIARYEMRTLLRSWFFRIFAGGAILGLGIFNIAMNVDASGAPWIYTALSASIPYANLIILNLGQAVVAVFLASEFLKQDRKNDTVEVIYARSMSNGQYILGKTMGILAVFLVLNIIVLLMGIGFSFISNSTSQNPLAYFIYPLLISLPTLVFILGLSFFTMALVKNQAVTFILLIGYIALTIFYLDKKAYHLFDFIAYQVPMMYSSISGFASFSEILLHRGIYLLLGIGLIVLSVYKLQRLPQSPRYARLPLFIGLAFICLSTAMIYHYLDRKRSLHEFRDQVMILNNKYAAYPKASVDSSRLELEHLDNKIAVSALLFLKNLNKVPVDTLILSLNPDLRVTSLSVNQQQTVFQRDLQIIKVGLPLPMNPGDSIQVKLNYTGTIDENIDFMDQDFKDFTSNPAYEVFRLRKRFAFLQKHYACLTSGSLWYPITGTGYATEAPMQYCPDFTRYSLRVKTTPGLLCISQGNVNEVEKGIFEFNPDYALPRITLLIGNYVKNTVNVDSVGYSIYSIKGHDYFKAYFEQISDTLPTLIRDLKKEYESRLELTYPFKQLILAEVPVHFNINIHKYAYASDAIQPEIILCPEKGVLFSSSDFKRRKYRLEKDLKNKNEEVLPIVIQADLFTQFVRRNFMSKRGDHFNYEELINWQTYSLFPQYLNFFTQLKSDHWPVLDIAMQTYTSERNNNAGIALTWYQGLTNIEKINLELNNASLKDLLKASEASDEEDKIQVSVRELVQVKGLHLFNRLSTKQGSRAIDSLLTRLILDHPHRSIDLEELNNRFRQQFNIDFNREVRDWYEQKSLPGFIIRNISSYKVMDGEVSKFQVRFQISNPEPVDGIITLNVEFNDPNRTSNNYNNDQFNVDFSRKIDVPAKSSYEIGYVFNTEPARMSMVTHISKNLPNNLMYGFSGFQETRNVPLLDEIKSIPFFDKAISRNEVIADNEDKDFMYKQTTNQAYLKSLINRKKEDRYKYSAIWAWNPPREWRAVLRSEFYGTYIHSAHYTRAGNGERTAYWKAALPSKGSYDIYYYVDKVDLGWRRTNKSPNYNISVYHDNGVDKIDQATEDVDNGWNYLGTFSISSDTGRVELSNKSSGDMVFADAVKWVLSK